MFDFDSYFISLFLGQFRTSWWPWCAIQASFRVLWKWSFALWHRQSHYTLNIWYFWLLRVLSHWCWLISSNLMVWADTEGWFEHACDEDEFASKIKEGNKGMLRLILKYDAAAHKPLVKFISLKCGDHFVICFLLQKNHSLESLTLNANQPHGWNTAKQASSWCLFETIWSVRTKLRLWGVSAFSQFHTFAWTSLFYSIFSP